MQLVFHAEVYSDIDTMMRYYEQVATPDLAVAFYAELVYCITKAAETPESFSVRGRDIRRRVNLKRFPYHFLYRIVGDSVRILVIRQSSKTA